MFNKAKSETLNNEHAGFLMGQGLSGHLTKLATLNVHDYLIKVCISSELLNCAYLFFFIYKAFLICIWLISIRNDINDRQISISSARFPPEV